MIAIRPVWNVAVPHGNDLPAQVSALLAIEERIVSASKVYLSLARTLTDEEYEMSLLRSCAVLIET